VFNLSDIGRREVVLCLFGMKIDFLQEMSSSGCLCSRLIGRIKVRMLAPWDEYSYSEKIIRDRLTYGVRQSMSLPSMFVGVRGERVYFFRRVL
jgi:hypothetical protein